MGLRRLPPHALRLTRHRRLPRLPGAQEQDDEGVPDGRTTDGSTARVSVAPRQLYVGHHGARHPGGDVRLRHPVLDGSHRLRHYDPPRSSLLPARLLQPQSHQRLRGRSCPLCLFTVIGEGARCSVVGLHCRYFCYQDVYNCFMTRFCFVFLINLSFV